MKNICILGSTGSIGRSSLEVIAGFPDKFRAAYLAAHRNVDLLQSQVKDFQPRGVALIDEASSASFASANNGQVRQFVGEEGLLELIRQDGIDIVINSMVGFAGLKPTIEAIKRRATIALANKETLVVAGEIIMPLVRDCGATLLPIDSEHSAILQCLAGEDPSNVSRLVLTASGGPFLHRSKEDFESITIQEALHHPTWKMGNKITVDSATMMNKGLEVIEAHWLFNLPAEKIEVVIHPQSIIHSMVEFVDGSIKAQLGIPDMKIPIQYALTYPQREASSYARVDFEQLSQMTFFKPDMDKFECLGLAYEALRRGGTTPAILNAANEVAVAAFLEGRLGFDQIPERIRSAMDSIKTVMHPDLDDIVDADAAARRHVEQYL